MLLSTLFAPDALWCLFTAKTEVTDSLLWLAAIQIFKRKQNLPGLAPKSSFIATEALDYAQHKPVAVKLINELLSGAGLSFDALMVRTLPNELDNIERIDRLITVSETRRNAMLREIDRRRAVLSEALRRRVQEVEGEFEVVERTPAATKSAASPVTARSGQTAPMLRPAPARKPRGAARTRRETRFATP